MARRDWKPLNEYLNIYFNELFVAQRDSIRGLAKNIAKQRRMINRIKDSKNTYLNDDAIIEDKEKHIKTMIEQKSVLKGRQERLLTYSMDTAEMNLLCLTLNKEIVNEIVKGKKYNFPQWMGSLYLRYVSYHRKVASIHWPRSIANHLEITKKDAPIIYDKYVNQKVIDKKTYFRLSKSFVAPAKPDKLWISRVEGGDWLYLSWKPNFGFINKHGNPYRFKFTAYNQLADANKLPNTTTEETLRYLDTPEKIINSRHLGNFNKIILLQLQDPNYKHKVDSL